MLICLQLHLRDGLVFHSLCENSWLSSAVYRNNQREIIDNQSVNTLETVKMFSMFLFRSLPSIYYLITPSN